MPVMMVGVYCRKIAKPAQDKIGIGLTRAIEMIAPKSLVVRCQCNALFESGDDMS